MKQNRFRTFLAAVDKYGGIPLTVIALVAFAVLMSLIPEGSADRPAAVQQQSDGHGEDLPISSASGPRGLLEVLADK